MEPAAEDFRVLACALDDELDAHPGRAPALLERMHAALLTQPDASDAFYDSWPTLLRAWDASPAAAAAVLRLAEHAADNCHPREVFSLYTEALSQDPCAAPGGAAMQLALLRLLPRVLLRLKRKWVAFLLDYLQAALRWCSHALPALPFRTAEPAAGSSPGEQAGEGSLPATLPAAVEAVAGSLALLAAFVLGQPAGAAAAAPPPPPPPAAAAVALSDEERRAAGDLLLQAGLQLAALAVQLLGSLGAAQARLVAVLSAPVALGRRLEALAPVAAACLCLPAAPLRAVLPLLPAPASTAGLLRVAQGLEQQQLAGRRGSAAGGRHFGEGESTDEESSEEDISFSAKEVWVGAALGLCAAVLQGGSSPAVVEAGGAGQLPALELPSATPELFAQLAPALQCLMDLAAQRRSAPLALLGLHCLSAACRRATMGGAPLEEGEDLEEVLQLANMLVTAMSFNPLELIRSCAHEALHSLLDVLEPQARLGLVMVLLEMPSSAAAVVALQRIRQEMVAAWDGTAEGASPFLEHHVFQAACEPFEQGEGGMRWRVEEDVLVNADAIAASLALYRFVLLRSTRSAKAPEGAPALRPTLVSAEGVASTLRQHLLPLRALTVRLLQLHTRHLGDAAGGTGPGTGGGGSSEGVAEEVEGWLGLQRLLDVVKRVVEIAQGWGES